MKIFLLTVLLTLPGCSYVKIGPVGLCVGVCRFEIPKETTAADNAGALVGSAISSYFKGKK